MEDFDEVVTTCSVSFNNFEKRVTNLTENENLAQNFTEAAMKLLFL